MAEAVSSDVDVVSKLKRRLHDAAHRQKQVETVLKVLNRLSLVHMTLDILKVTHIGKEVNGLRKWEGGVGEKAKALVKKWKQLLPDSESPSAGNSSSTTPISITNGQEERTSGHGQHGHKSKKGERVEHGHAHRMYKSSSHVAVDGLKVSSSESDDFSRALMSDPSAPLSSTPSSGKRTKDTEESSNYTHTSPTHKHKHKSKHKNSRKDTVKNTSSHLTDVKHRSPSAQTTSLSSSTSPPLRHLGATGLSALTRPKSPPQGSFLDIPSLPVGPSYSPKSDDPSSCSVASRKRKAFLNDG